MVTFGSGLAQAWARCLQLCSPPSVSHSSPGQPQGSRASLLSRLDGAAICKKSIGPVIVISTFSAARIFFGTGI
jgi:hypothetical protein